VQRLQRLRRLSPPIRRRRLAGLATAPVAAIAALLVIAGCGAASGSGADRSGGASSATASIEASLSVAISTAQTDPAQTQSAQTQPAQPASSSSTAPADTGAAPPSADPTGSSDTPPDTPYSGSGTFSTSTLAYPAAGPGSVWTYAVQVEDGVPVDANDFAQAVHATLTDPRGWQGVDGVAFEMVADPKAAAFVVTLATPATTDELCAPLDTGGWLDCYAAGRAVINSDRWLLGADSWGGDLAGYRQMVVNHEVGHAIGHDHLYCPGPGQPAPVMQQQTISLQGCAPNAWPAVTGG
jgi:hypothetical protein